MWRWLVIVLTGCSSSTPDPGPDPEPEPPENECTATEPGTVRIHSPGFHSIYFTHDADGAFVERYETGDSPEIVDMTVPPCGAVTFLERTRTFYETTTNLVDGDELYTFVGGPFVQPPQAKIVIDTPLENTTNYLASGGDLCSGQGLTNISMDYTSACTTGTTGSIVVIPNDLNPHPLSFAVFEDVDLAATQSSPLHVTSWQTAAPQHRFTISLDSPPEAVGCFVASLRGLASYPYRQANAAQLNAESNIDVQFPELGDGHTYFCSAITESNERSYRTRAAGPLAENVTIAEGDLLPAVLEASMSQDSARPTVTYSIDRDAVEEDITMVSISEAVSPDGTRQVAWRGVAPGGTRTLQVPQFPADFAPTFDPRNAIRVSLYETTAANGFREAVRDTTPFLIARYALPLQTIRSTEFPPSSR